MSRHHMFAVRRHHNDDSWTYENFFWTHEEATECAHSLLPSNDYVVDIFGVEVREICAVNFADKQS